MIYGNVEDFKQYFTERGKTLPDTWTDEKITSALLVSSEWLDSSYENVWIGYKTDGFKQERSWPRTTAIVQSFPFYVYQTDEIPQQVVQATYEAALRQLEKPGCLHVDFTPSKYKSVRVEGAVAVEYNSEILYQSDVQLQIEIVQNLMLPLLDENKGGNFSILSGPVSRV